MMNKGNVKGYLVFGVLAGVLVWGMNKEEVTAKHKDFILPQSSYEYLDWDDVADLSKKELNYARNEIYARHGRMFYSEELMDYFNRKWWYEGTVYPDDFQSSWLSECEMENIMFLKEVEHLGGYGYQLD